MSINTNKQKTILLAVSSGIAAFKVIDLAKSLRRRGYQVFVMMTKHATQMISPLAFEQQAKVKVVSELFADDFNYQEILQTRTVEHISLAEKADIVCVVPATANIIAKIRYGLADDLLTTTLLATRAPVLVCPSMNVHMWEKEITQENVQALAQRDQYHILPPAEGPLACGYIGKGRLPEISLIEKEILRLLSAPPRTTPKVATKIKVLITAGGTEAAIDAVRVITNRSSGKMGLALAEVCLEAGMEVLFIHGHISVSLPHHHPHFRSLFTPSAKEMSEAIKKEIKEQTPPKKEKKEKKATTKANKIQKLVIHAAAVSDYLVNVKNGNQGKLSSQKKINLQLVPGPKILPLIKKKWNNKIFLIGFKAEVGLTEKELIVKARQQMAVADCDMVVANDVGEKKAFGQDENEVLLVKKNKVLRLPKISKRAVAKKIIDEILPALLQTIDVARPKAAREK